MTWAILAGLLGLLPERWALAIDRRILVPINRGL